MADDDGNSLDSLPLFKDAIKLPLEEYYKYANGVFEYRENCQSKLAEANEKFYEWCQAMNCVEFKENCKIPWHPAMTTVTSVTDKLLMSITSRWPPTTLSYIDMIKAVGHNGTCYDDFYCTQQSMAPYLHYFLGIICLIFCLGGILSNLLFIPAFNVTNNRTGSTLYLTAMALCDCFYMILFTLIVVIRYIPYDYILQLEMYSRFTAYLIPQGLPTMQIMELISVWITVALLVDRFLYLKFGFHSKLICSRKLSAKIISVLIILLILYTVPKFLEYQLIAYPEFGIVKVMYTTVGFSESFQNLLLHWLKVPVEMFLPYLAVAIFSVINSIKLYDLMFKRKLSEASKERKIQYDNDYLEYKKLNIENDDKDYENAQRFPSLAIDSKIPMITSSLKSLEDKENAVVIVILVLGFSLLALKIPKFVLHALKSESYVEPNSTKFFQPAADFLDLIWVVSKPIVFSITKPFRRSLVSVFCCKDMDDGGVTIQVKPALEIELLASDYVSKLQRSVDHRTAEESKLLVTETKESNVDVITS